MGIRTTLPRCISIKKYRDGSVHSLNAGETPSVNNFVCTSRYTLFNFLPFNLFEQLMVPANSYFMCVAILQMIPAFSTTSGIPTMALPLLFVLSVSALKAAFEDWRRHIDDAALNSRRYMVWQGTNFTEMSAGDIKVGNIIRLRRDEEVPADSCILHVSHSRGQCFVDTAGIDGESELKVRFAAEHCQKMNWMKSTFEESDQLEEFKLQFEDPSPELNQFNAVLSGNFITTSASDNTERIPLHSANTILCGSCLRNTAYAIIVIVYAGVECKIRVANRHSSRSPLRVKRSRLMKMINRCLFFLLALLGAMCTTSAVFSSVWIAIHTNSAMYLSLFNSESSYVIEIINRSFTWFIILSQIVPISLLVSVEVVKMLQAAAISRTKDEIIVRNSAINEDLGQIEYLLTDKTGTLTRNELKVRTLVIDSEFFGSHVTEMTKLANKHFHTTSSSHVHTWCEHEENLKANERNNDSVLQDEVDEFLDTSRLLTSMWPETSMLFNHTDTACYRALSVSAKFLVHLAVSNTITTVLRNDIAARRQSGTDLSISSNHRSRRNSVNAPLELQSNSPDELALCEFAQRMGVILSQRRDGIVHVHNEAPMVTSELVFREMGVLGFTSKRKRATIVFRIGDDIVVMCKGADSVMMSLCDQRAPTNFEADVNELASQGLRTLAIAESVLPLSWFENWRHHFDAADVLPEIGNEAGHARGSCLDACLKCSVFEDIERDAHLSIIGIVAIEDRLQALVPECLEDFNKAGIRVWMMTGDKRRTAIAVGVAVKLVNADQTFVDGLAVAQIVSIDPESIQREIEKAECRLSECKHTEATLCVVVEGCALSVIMKDRQSKLCDRFFAMAMICRSIIGCRLSPHQKAAVVREVRERSGSLVCAIGDGANDVEMIQAADVGVGMTGKEGTAASRQADFAVQRFHATHALFLVHGVWSYVRLAKLVLFVFYKASLVPLSMFAFGFVSGFSGEQFFNDMLFGLYNILFTALPVVIIGISDEVLSRRTLSNQAHAYRGVAHNAFFNLRLFLFWNLIAILDVAWSFGFVSLSIGETVDRVTMATTVFSIIVIAANLKVLVLMSTIGILQLAASLLSVLGYCLLIFPISLVPNTDMFMVAFQMASNPAALLSIFLAVAVSLLASFAFRAASVHWSPTLIDLLREKDIIESRIRTSCTTTSHESYSDNNVTNISPSTLQILPDDARDDTHKSLARV